MVHEHYLDLLREVRDVIIIDLSPYTLQVVDEFRNKLYSPIKGLYLKGSIDPIAYDAPDRVYHTKKNGREIIVPFSDILNSDYNIYDHNGDPIAVGKIAKNKKHYLTETPPSDSILVRILRAYCLKVVDQHTIKFAPKPSDVDIDKFILPKYKNDITIDLLNTELENLQSSIVNFINQDNWNLYSYKFKGRVLIIEKGIDFRVYDWHKIQYEKQHKDE